MCHMPSFEEKNFSYFFSMGVFSTLLRGCNKKIFAHIFQIFLFRLSNQQNYYKNEHFYDNEKCLCPPCATVRVLVKGGCLLSNPRYLVPLMAPWLMALSGRGQVTMRHLLSSCYQVEPPFENFQILGILTS